MTPRSTTGPDAPDTSMRKRHLEAIGPPVE